MNHGVFLYLKKTSWINYNLGLGFSMFNFLLIKVFFFNLIIADKSNGKAVFTVTSKQKMFGDFERKKK
jgi:hypothetical protein